MINNFQCSQTSVFASCKQSLPSYLKQFWHNHSSNTFSLLLETQKATKLSKERAPFLGFTGFAKVFSQPSGCLLMSSREPFLTARCRRACLAKWSLRMNRLRHMGQANLFSPVWVRRWRDSSSERANCRSQPSHLHLKGFSPVARQDLVNFLIASDCSV